MRAAFHLALLLLLTPVAALATPGTHTVPYKEFHDQMARFYGNGHDRLALRLSLQPAKPDQPLAEPVTMVAVAPDGPAPLSVGDDNVVDIPYRPEWVAANVAVTVNQAPASYVMRAQIGMKLPSDTTSLSYADVKAAFDQFDRLIDKEAGVVSFLAPSAKTVRFVCGTDCTVTLEGGKGVRVLKADDKGRVNIPNDKALARENPTLTVNRPVAYTVLTTKG